MQPQMTVDGGGHQCRCSTRLGLELIHVELMPGLASCEDCGKRSCQFSGPVLEKPWTDVIQTRGFALIHRTKQPLYLLFRHQDGGDSIVCLLGQLRCRSCWVVHHHFIGKILSKERGLVCAARDSGSVWSVFTTSNEMTPRGLSFLATLAELLVAVGKERQQRWQRGEAEPGMWRLDILPSNYKSECRRRHESEYNNN
ncbi:hypothetical protein E2C01_045273 [Portunus trituberculatus]|uniref:Uncharacterized protein n=1 Tax=Portunus trituberculatus TaxID=210409 RepID=A0A5B7G1M9_PORTR|nr:hypothetical protein [Portunus trituberculatus]